MNLSPRESLAKSAARVVDQLEFSPVDLSGRIRGWYRLVQGEDAWFGDAATSVVDADRPVELEFVRNTDIEVVVEVPEEPVEPWPVTVGTAVHAQFLVGEIRRILELQGWHWRLSVDGTMLDPWQLLDDFDLAPGATVQVVRSTGHRRTNPAQEA